MRQSFLTLTEIVLSSHLRRSKFALLMSVGICNVCNVPFELTSGLPNENFSLVQFAASPSYHLVCCGLQWPDSSTNKPELCRA